MSSVTTTARLRREAVASVIGRLDRFEPVKRTQDRLIEYANLWLRRRNHGSIEMDRKALSRDLESMALWEARRWPQGRPSATSAKMTGRAAPAARASSRDRAAEALKDAEIAELKRTLTAFEGLKLVEGYLDWAKAHGLVP